MSVIIINASSLFTGTFLRSITQNGAAKMNQSAGEQLQIVFMSLCTFVSGTPELFFIRKQVLAS